MRFHSALGLADAMLAGPATAASVRARCAKALGGKPEWLASLAKDMLRAHAGEWHSVIRKELARTISLHPAYQAAWADPQPPRIRRYFLTAPALARPPFALQDCTPALANLCAFNLDLRLQAAAEALGARYTRYADDLVFSGGRQFERSAQRFVMLAGSIALEEGFSVNFRKTRIMSRAACQRVTGIVVNEKLNVKRTERDRLKAILHNCVLHGPASQNKAGLADFRAHLLGRLARMNSIAPLHGRRMERLFEQISW